MLKQNHDKNIKEQKLHQAVLKHKVRNLRAKVQSLLPIHLCEKIQKRNNRITKQLVRKKILEKQQRQISKGDSNQKLQKAWMYTVGNIKRKDETGRIQKTVENNYFSSSKNSSIYRNKCQFQTANQLFIDDQYNGVDGGFSVRKTKEIELKGYHFEKLTDQQIEQIEEDKLYYLGEDGHIKAYEKFIKQKLTTKTITPISNEVYKSVSRSTIAIGTNKNIKFPKKHMTNTSLQSQSKLKHSSIIHKYSRNNSLIGDQNDQRNKYCMTSSKGTKTSAVRMFRNTINDKFYPNVNQNLVRINEEEQVKRILLSMEIKSKQERVEENFVKIRNNKLQIIQKENLKDQQKMLTAQSKKRKIHNQAGQIVDLTQKLRKKCIKRKSHRETPIDKYPYNQTHQEGFT